MGIWENQNLTSTMEKMERVEKREQIFETGLRDRI
jgi:hypothetical protein